MAMKKEAKVHKGWQKPPEGMIMINVDASFDDDEGCGSTGVVIRDHLGGVIAAAHSFTPHVIDATMVEAYALKEGLLLAQHVGENRIIIQSDCLEVVETMKDGGFSANSAAAIYDECITIWSGFQEISIQHCSRDANCVAHELARRARQSKQDCIRDDEPSSFIYEFVLRDVTIFN
jgi:ribonuclease HI